VDELSTTVLLAGLGATLILGWRRLAARSRAFVLFCLVLVFGTPLVFDLLGHWAFYYSYLRFVPASLAVFATLSDLSQTLGGLGSRLGKGAILASVALAMAIGLPTRLFLTARYSQLMPRKEIQRAIQANRGKGIDRLKQAIVAASRSAGAASTNGVATTSPIFPEAFQREAIALARQLPGIEPFVVQRLLIDIGGYTEQVLAKRFGPIQEQVDSARQRLYDAGCGVPAIEARTRYAWIRQAMTGCVVRKMRCMPASTAWPRTANSGPRWSRVGMSMARSTRSGTLVGPGICRKCLPVCTVMSVLPGIALVSRGSNITIWRACPPPGEGRQCLRSRALPCQAGPRQARHCRTSKRTR
jgi:hypothetical protein